MAAAWKQEADNLGISGSVDFLGNLPLESVAAELRQAHVFCLPSIRESGGAVLLEAMASSRPLIAIAHGGPAEIVDDSVGLCIEPRNPEYVVNALADALRDIVAHSDVWRRRGETGYRRAAEQYEWDAKISRALALYEEVLKGSRQ